MRDIHNPAVILAYFLVLGILSSLAFVLGPGIPPARSEEYTTQTSERPNKHTVRKDRRSALQRHDDGHARNQRAGARQGYDTAKRLRERVAVLSLQSLDPSGSVPA